LGHKETSSLCFSRQPIVTSANIVNREPVPEVPNELRRLRRQLGLDFGQFQYVESAGRVVLYAATRTPTLDHLDPDEYLPEVNLLAEGITTWL
jgi:hypothetical protein